MENLNELEVLILNKLSLRYPAISYHIPFLRVSSREFTGVGMYVNFCYIETNQNIPIIEIDNGSISTNELIMTKGLKNGLGYEVDILNGFINFIEFVSNGEEWDGSFKEYRFEPF